MTDKIYKYDVAFSFLQQDETISFKINDLIQDRFKTFIYSHHQKEIAGTDGEVTFNKVFSEEARTVVVLYRNGWGENSWTRIEETALRNRAHDEGYDFVTFVLLDKESTVPKWLPKCRIWVDYSRWKEKGAASVIEARIQEQGGHSRQENTEEQFKRIQREVNFEQEKYTYLQTSGASDDAFNLFFNLVDMLKAKISQITDPKLGFIFSTEEKAGEYFIFHCNLHSLHFYWNHPSPRSLSNSSLTILLTRFAVERENPLQRNQESRLLEKTYDFDKNINNIHGWNERRNKDNFFTNELFIEFWIREFLNRIKDERINSLKR